MVQGNAHNKTISGEAFQLMPGTAVLVSVAGSADGTKGVYVGAEPGQYLLLRLPPSARNKHNLVVGKEIDVKFMHYAGMVGGFRSEVFALLDTPVQLVFVKSPKSVDLLSRREHQRLSTFWPATVVYDEQAIDGCVLNFSIGGCLFSIRCSEPVEEPACLYEETDEKPQFELGAEIACILRSPLVEEEKLVVGKVRSVIHREGAIDIGIQFKTLSDDLEKSISLYLEQVEAFTEL